MIVGLTGGIGSGKSEVSRRFQELGIIVVDADMVAREVVEPGQPALQAIADHFGKDILKSSATDADFVSKPALDREKLREIIFTNPVEKTWLENLLHPIIRTSIIEQLNQATSDYTILASPLLLETNQHQLVQRILVVDASEELQIIRASSRDTNTKEQIELIIKSQISRAERLKKADDIIYNHGGFAELDQQVNNLHNHYLSLSKK